MFVNEKGKVVSGLSDKKWLWVLALLCDVSHHINYFITKTQVQQKLISDMFGAVRTF
jgi:hypothetical protein